MPPRAFITGIGLLTPLGTSTQTTWRTLLSSTTAIQPYTIDPQIPIHLAARINRTTLPNLHTPLPQCPDFATFALHASSSALLDAQLPSSLPQTLSLSAGVSLGVGMAHLSTIQTTSDHLSNLNYRKISPYTISRILPNTPAGLIALEHNLKGPILTPATACAAGAHALGDALHAIQRGDVEIMLAGGSEAAIHPIAIAGFARAQALSGKETCRPFDMKRKGFVLGEGAAVLVIEAEQSVRRRGVKAYAELKGFGMSGDAYHVTAPAPDGSGALRAMKKAVENAAVTVRDVDYVNAHATGTNIGDLIERRTIAKLLPVEKVGRKAVVSATKGMTGHLLGAAGAVETAFAVLTVAEGMVPQTVGLDELEEDEVCEELGWGDVDRFVTEGCRKMEVNVALSNSFGFGGTNACVAVAKPPADLCRTIECIY